MIIPQQEAQEADDFEHEDPENVVEISSGNSSSDLSEGTLNFIRQIDEKLQKATQSVPNKTDSVNQQTPQTSPEETPSPNYFIPQCDSPSNLFSLERHLGGEITKTPQKATKSVPKKIDLVNQNQLIKPPPNKLPLPHQLKLTLHLHHKRLFQNLLLRQ